MPRLDYSKDFPAFCRNCLKIRDKDGQLVAFFLNPAQMRLWLIVKADLQAGKPVRIIILKPRQTGISTFWLAIEVWIATQFAHKRILVISHEDDSAKNLLNIFRFFKNNLPDEEQPRARIDNREEIYFDEIDSRVLIDTARNKNAGKSFTFNIVHMSEVGSWESQSIEASTTYTSLVQALPNRPGTFEIMESTSELGGVFFEQKWKSKSRFHKVFIPWFADPGYTIPEGQRGSVGPFPLYPRDDSPYGNEVEEEETLRNELRDWYPDLSDLALECEIWARLIWRRQTIEEKCNWDIPTFHRNYPSKAEQAFQVSSGKIFDEQKLQFLLEHRPPSVHYKTNEKYTQLVTTAKMGDRTGFFTIALKMRECLTDDRAGKVLITELPDPTFNYVLGADVGEGLPQGDFSAFVIYRLFKSHLTEVCSYQARIEPKEFAYLLYAFGKWYFDALLGVEINYSGATTVVDVLQRELFYPNLYQRENFDTTAFLEHRDAYGWFTDRKNKPQMRDEMRDLLNYGRITLSNPELINNLIEFRKLKNGNYGISTGAGHDDIGMASLITTMMAKAYYDKDLKSEAEVDPNSWEGLRRHHEKEQFDDMEARFIL